MREISQGESSITIANIDDLTITRLVQAGIPAASLETALRPIITKKTELAELERQLETLEAERQTIVDDQERLRENMKALRGSAEEKQLLQRYTRQLDDQESRLVALKQEVDKTTRQVAKSRGELNALIGGITFELTAPSR